MKVWRETLALMGATCWYAAACVGLVYGTELATRLLPVSSWTWERVIV